VNAELQVKIADNRYEHWSYSIREANILTLRFRKRKLKVQRKPRQAGTWGTNKYFQAELINSQIRFSVAADYNEKLAKSRSDRPAEASLADGRTSFQSSRIKSEYVGAVYIVRAPQTGYVVKTY
jgi:hypothetical protein